MTTVAYIHSLSRPSIAASMWTFGRLEVANGTALESRTTLVRRCTG
jgi:hypothetical protein